MKIRYNGDHETMLAYGYNFSGGAVVEVTEPFALGKFINNSHFDVIPEPEPDPELEPEPEVEAEDVEVSDVEEQAGQETGETLPGELIEEDYAEVPTAQEAPTQAKTGRGRGKSKKA